MSPGYHKRVTPRFHRRTPVEMIVITGLRCKGFRLCRAELKTKKKVRMPPHPHLSINPYPSGGYSFMATLFLNVVMSEFPQSVSTLYSVFPGSFAPLFLIIPNRAPLRQVSRSTSSLPRGPRPRGSRVTRVLRLWFFSTCANPKMQFSGLTTVSLPVLCKLKLGFQTIEIEN